MSTSRKICPLLNAASYDGAFCKGDQCAWFHLEYHPDGDFTSGKCAMVRIADKITKDLVDAAYTAKEKETRGA